VEFFHDIEDSIAIPPACVQINEGYSQQPIMAVGGHLPTSDIFAEFFSTHAHDADEV